MSTQWKSNQVKFKQIIHQWCSTVKGLKIYVAQVWYATEPFELSIFMEKLLQSRYWKSTMQLQLNVQKWLYYLTL